MLDYNHRPSFAEHVNAAVDRALIADQAGVYVFVVEDGKAVVRRIKVGGNIGANVVVTDGLTAGQPVIVEGFEALRPGAAVRATPATSLRG